MKTVTVDSVYLKGGSYYITENPKDAFRVTEGKVFVYVVPLRNGEVGRRTLVYEANIGEIIPSFCYKDMDYCTWGFCFVAAEEATLVVMENMVTTPLKKKFAERSGVLNFQQEGFENGLVDLYRMNLVREDGYIMRTAMEKQSTIKRTDDLVVSMFSKSTETADDNTENPLYDALNKLCRSEGISISPYEKIKACCGKKITVQDIARISHFSCRKTILQSDWYKKDAGALLVYLQDGNKPAACIQRGTHSYNCYIPGEGVKRVNKELAERIKPSAYTIYKPFPQEKITPKKFAYFCIKSVRIADILLIAVMTVVSALIGLILPTLNRMLYDEYIPMGEKNVIMQIGGLFASFIVGNLFFSIVKSICGFRLQSRVKIQAQNAAYSRVFGLHEHFFRNYDSADLAGRVMGVGELAGSYTGLIVTTLVTGVSLLFYLWQMFSYSVSMSAFSLLMFAVYILVILLISDKKLKHQREMLEIQGKTDSVMYQFLGGITKIRVAGIEDRAVYEYMKPFVKERKIAEKVNRAEYIGEVISAAFESLFLMLFYIIAFNSVGLSTGEFVAFTSAFGAASATVAEIVRTITGCRTMASAYNRVRPLLETEPENTADRVLPGELDGSIDIEHLTFSYGENQTQIFNDLSLHINPGEYVGIVGGSGCGKSTLLKLLLGFEKPNSGKIYYSNQDMDTLDLQELRKKFGVVLQDGKLIAGSIFENITITSPAATLSDVNRVIEMVGLKKDIDDMPMGLHTVLSEDCSTISGGQQQRILIARAIINNPQILFFDEATSALDNLTQSMVCESLEKMNSTRIVIAHRLTTIMNCHRIIVLGNGEIQEQGTYEQLMAEKGIFWQLASRQMMG